MNCEDMMKLPELQKVLNIKAGESGINRFVRWIYFADCLQCVQSEYKVENYIHGGEFVILTNPMITENTEELLAMVEQMRQHNIAALGINEGQISEKLVDYCNQSGLPLFELPEKYPLVDLSQVICQKLVSEKTVKDSLERLFSFILNTESFDKDKIFAQASSLGIDLDCRLSVVEFVCVPEKNVVCEKEDEEKHQVMGVKNKGQDFNIVGLQEEIKTMIDNEFFMQSSEKLLFLTQVDSILMLLPMEKIVRERFEQIVQNLVEKIRKKFHMELIAGVGNADYLENIKSSRKEAAFVIRISKITNENKNIYYYREQGIYTFISQIGDIRLLDDFVKEHIGKLIHADEINNGNLCETLEKYIQNNCNVKETAEAMFVHRNTLNYRLNKIREIIDDDFDDLNGILMLKLSFMIYNYRKG